MRTCRGLAVIVGLKATASGSYQVGGVKSQISGAMSYGVADMDSTGAI
jgi:hypothetical protein